MEGEEDEWYKIMDNKWISRMDISLQEMDIEGTAGLPGLVFISQIVSSSVSQTVNQLVS